MTTSIRSLAKAEAMRALLASVLLASCTGGINGSNGGVAGTQAGTLTEV